MSVEHDLRRALIEAAADVDAPDRWDEIEHRAAARRRRRRAWRGSLGGVGLVAAALVGLAVLPGLVRHSPSKVSTTASSVPAPQPSVVPTVPTVPVEPATTVAPTPATAPPTTTRPTGPADLAGGFQPLWPFATGADVQVWQDAYRSGGTQPWHLDPDQTALGFTQGYLGYQEIDRVVSRTVGATDAEVAVGFESEGGRTSTAAVIHLVRFGSGPEAPWEVVGTNDGADFSLTTPAYGAIVTSPLSVGGSINGVDESIAVEVHQLSSEGPIGRQCCVPAGNTGVPWQTSVPFAGARDRVLTVSAATGGHLKAVERFTVTGVRASA